VSRKTPTVSLEEAKARFENWRQNRKGKATIPDELWAAAVEVAGKEGINWTSTELRVEWNHLKRRMAAASKASTKPAPPAFLELVAPRPQQLPECIIELEAARRQEINEVLVWRLDCGGSSVNGRLKMCYSAPVHFWEYPARF
jgi:hypothetical protein